MKKVTSKIGIVIKLYYIVLFLPKKDSNSILFYGTQNVYYMIRFYFTLYERLQKAYLISRIFLPNTKTAILTEEVFYISVCEVVFEFSKRKN